ncbi:MAG: hypothetical protein QF752_08190 [Planctomycetota bacterium]|jgi:hypothetical protein|nr:hypothetical protein [Planctomycetota bacterium]
MGISRASVLVSVTVGVGVFFGSWGICAQESVGSSQNEANASERFMAIRAARLRAGRNLAQNILKRSPGSSRTVEDWLGNRVKDPEVLRALTRGQEFDEPRSFTGEIVRVRVRIGIDAVRANLRALGWRGAVRGDLAEKNSGAIEATGLGMVRPSTRPEIDPGFELGQNRPHVDRDPIRRDKPQRTQASSFRSGSEWIRSLEEQGWRVELLSERSEENVLGGDCPLRFHELGSQPVEHSVQRRVLREWTVE